MNTVLPTEFIELMREQGVNEHLIDLVSMNIEAFIALVGRNIENGAIYKQFINTTNSMQTFRYASAAGLISRADADFLDDFVITHLAPDPGPV